MYHGAKAALYPVWIVFREGAADEALGHCAIFWRPFLAPQAPWNGRRPSLSKAIFGGVEITSGAPTANARPVMPAAFYSDSQSRQPWRSHAEVRRPPRRRNNVIPVGNPRLIINGAAPGGLFFDSVNTLERRPRKRAYREGRCFALLTLPASERAAWRGARLFPCAPASLASPADIGF